jgi:hypothetical protein
LGDLRHGLPEGGLSVAEQPVDDLIGGAAPGRVRLWLVPVGLPVADGGQAPALLDRGLGVEPVAALLEVADDAVAVFDGVGRRRT